MAVGQNPDEGKTETASKIPHSILLGALMVVVVAGVLTNSLARHSLSVQTTAFAAAIVLLLLSPIFVNLKEIPKDSRSRLLLSVFWLSCVVWIVTAGVWGTIASNSRLARPSSEHTLIELSADLSTLRASYRTLLDSPAKASIVNKEANQLVEKILRVNDSELGLSMQIFKYQSLAYTQAMVAGSEMIAGSEFGTEEKLKSVDAILKACNKAEALIIEARQPRPLDQKAQDIREWIIKDASDARVQRLMAVALCFRWRINGNSDDHFKARKIINGLPAYYLASEHPEQSYELQPCLSDK
jgi:hypothetical protein